jgi:hypothetical protein
MVPSRQQTRDGRGARIVVERCDAYEMMKPVDPASCTKGERRLLGIMWDEICSDLLPSQSIGRGPVVLYRGRCACKTEGGPWKAKKMKKVL